MGGTPRPTAGCSTKLIDATPLIDNPAGFDMRTSCKPTKLGCCALALVFSGCWMGGNSRSSYRPPSGSPTPPAINTPQYGPAAPFPQSQPSAPTLDGPILDGPAFPQSSAGEPLSSPGFDRKRHTQQLPEEDSRPNFAGTSPPPIIPDGPIASQTSKNPERTIGYIELPPAP
jgi:hypothetical protein